jgi:hypothetical protein
LSGVRELGIYIHVGTAKAQSILSSGILQEAGVAYKIGDRHYINRDKLDEYLKNNPTALAKVASKYQKK